MFVPLLLVPKLAAKSAKLMALRQKICVNCSTMFGRASFIVWVVLYSVLPMLLNPFASSVRMSTELTLSPHRPDGRHHVGSVLDPLPPVAHRAVTV